MEWSTRASDSATQLRLSRGPQAREVLAGMVRGAGQRARRHHQEALGPRDRFVGLELFRRDEAIDGGVLAGRLLVLVVGVEVDVGRAHVVFFLFLFLFGLV